VRSCILIPHYCHERQVADVIARVSLHRIPVLVIDDGSPATSFAQVQAAVAEHEDVVLDRIPVNKGKGAAIVRGLQIAAERGFTHAVQVDADGQHDIEKVADLLRLAASRPDALVSGFPVFDATVPSVRLKGRQISVFWARINTWSRDITDPMCGLRVYPVQSTLRLVGNRTRWMGMEFDIEIMVRAHWAGMPVLFVPVSVVYPPDGVSHFRMLRDNVLISLMHTRMFLGMLVRSPMLFWRKFIRSAGV
jgi:glycosyltransferase involved in cell wall biosynthesis